MIKPIVEAKLAPIIEKQSVTEERYKILMEQASCGIFISKTNGVILEVNKKAEELFDCSKDQIIGKSYENFILASDLTYTHLLIQKLLEEKSIGPSEGRIQQANGNIRDIEYSIALVKIGNEDLFIAVLNDVSDRNRLRSKVLLSDKLAVVGTLAAGVVHDINTPVTWISENLKTLKENIKNLKEKIAYSNLEKVELERNSFAKGFNEQLHNFIELINESIQGMEEVRNIVLNLKSFACVDEEAASLLDVHEILNTTIKIASHEFKSNIKIEKEFDRTIPKSLLQRGKLQQVFLNLIVNAVQSIPATSSRNEFVRIKTYLEKNEIHIDISDSGTGIDPKIMPKIFDQFFTTKPIGVGSGLGLSICREIISNLGGQIKVKSVFGTGSTFSVILPLKLDQDHYKIDPAIFKKVISRAHILVVDDEPSLLRTIQRILEKYHDVTTAQGGRTALEILNQKDCSFDLIITDFSMPDVSGADLYHFLANKKAGLEHRVIFVSGGIDPVQHKEFLATLSNPCIAKPFTKEELLQVVNMMLEDVHSH